MRDIDAVHDAETVTPESTTGGIMTPITESSRVAASVVEWLSSNTDETWNAEPEANQIFLIIDKSSGRGLTCHNGEVRLEARTNIGRNWQWRCVEKDGFFGFQNVAEGGFLGHDFWWHICAREKHHLGWECISVDRRPGGGYWMKLLHWWTYWQLSARTDHNGLFAERHNGTLWEFVRVDAN
ncbi:hypothetical protein S40285_08016 [Stachybotrys chlorohalonatus IBT 40285]|uniref:Ricin B lectin domain-containing protein n=1 Tax=Stachybotrys chlorohalonatus (strain IBT 40285) TaxID=1283841 RepID=A0A084Q7N3_STAC4|nr:hypothetical protein S40285_08016 [Stachybotrys chlorohalonata IBT 40285]